MTYNNIIYQIIMNNDEPANHYQEENQLLRQLHLQRMRARKQQEQQEAENEELVIEKSIKKIQNENNNPHHDIMLNMVMFDKRSPKPNFFIKMFSLFNENPKEANPTTISANIESIFITTFGFEIQTFTELLSSIKCPLYLYNHSDHQGQTKILKKYGGHQNLTIIQPPKKTQGYGVFHIKLWLIKFKSFLRVVVCTSNQHLYDWAIWQNAFWYQDFPLKTVQHQDKNFEGFNYVADFKQTLNELMIELLPKNFLSNQIKINLDNYNFNEVEVVLIPSLPGRHEGKMKEKQGINKLQNVMKKLKNKIKNPILTYSSTSLGVIDETFIRELFYSFCPSAGQFKPSNYRLVYPTSKYIQEETCGQAQVLFLMKHNYEKSDLKKQIFHRFEYNTQNPIVGCIPHLKVVIIEDEQNPQSCFLYMGSHNMTRAAWGKNEKNGKCFISNSELGLLFIDYKMEKLKSWCPFKYPPTKYGSGDQPYFRD